MGSPSDLPPPPEREQRARVEAARSVGTNGHGSHAASDRHRPNQIVIDPEAWGHDAAD